MSSKEIHIQYFPSNHAVVSVSDVHVAGKNHHIVESLLLSFLVYIIQVYTFMKQFYRHTCIRFVYPKCEHKLSSFFKLQVKLYITLLERTGREEGTCGRYGIV